MTDKTVTTNYFQLEYMFMELFQKNFFLREARSMTEMTEGRMHNDLCAFIEKLEYERDSLKKRIHNVCYE